MPAPPLVAVQRGQRCLITGQARLEYISALWQADVDDALTEEERSHLPPFNVSALYWDVMVDYEYQGRVHSFRTAGDDHGSPDEVSDEEAPPPSCGDQ